MQFELPICKICEEILVEISHDSAFSKLSIGPNWTTFQNPGLLCAPLRDGVRERSLIHSNGRWERAWRNYDGI